MKREEKLKLLQAIKDGKLSISDLRPPQVFIFMERDNKPGIYEHEGKEYNETEYKEFCERLEKRKNGSIIWNEKREYLKEDLIITMCHSGKSFDPSDRDCI